MTANNNLQQKFDELISLIRSYDDKVSDIDFVGKAWEFAKIAHTGQKRLSGDPYVSHLIEVAKILVSWKLDITSVVAGILHDTVEDGGAEKEDVLNEFGPEIASLVDGVTKVSDLKLRGSREEEFVENLRKMFLAMAKDLRVVLIKLADRLHNMRTLSFLPPEKQKRIARETLEVYAPLAERLGMGEVKGELEDLAFPFVYPEGYKKVTDISKIYYKRAEEIIKKMKRSILTRLSEEGINAKIRGRKKHYFSLWRKLERPEIEWDFEKVYDIFALRVLIEKIPECYAVLGVVHALYKPVPYVGFSDFISQPKPNGYRSIHTKVLGPRGKIVEIQIRTFQMHEEAEYGLAAHWYMSSLKNKGKITSKGIDEGKFSVEGEKLTWVKQLVEWQKEITDSKKFLEAVKFDALSKRIFVFSPKGDVYDLPLGATSLDFAFTVHTDLPHYIKSIKANGKIVNFDHELKSGDLVEIIKAKNPKDYPPHWLEIVKTTIARREIGKFLRRLEK